MAPVWCKILEKVLSLSDPWREIMKESDNSKDEKVILSSKVCLTALKIKIGQAFTIDSQEKSMRPYYVKALNDLRS